MLASPRPSASASAYHVVGVHDDVPVMVMLSSVRYLFLGTAKENVSTVVVEPASGVNAEPDSEPLDMDNVGPEVPPEPEDE